MFDYADDEVENKFIYNRSRRREDDFSAKMLPVGTFHSDFGFMAGDYASQRVPQTRRHQTKPTSLFLTQPLPRSDAGKVFPPSEENVDHPDSFFNSMRFVVDLAQIFSLLPVTGHRGPNYKSLHFRWTHWKTAYFAAYVVLSGFMSFCVVLQNITHGFSYMKSAGLVFYVSSLASSLLILKMATDWRQINFNFAEAERNLRKYGYPNGITRQFKLLTCAYMVIALIEHALSKVVLVHLTLHCVRDELASTAVETFFANGYTEVFTYVPFNMWLALILFLVHFMCTFTWNFSDLLLTLISLSISRRFKRFNEYLFSIQGKAVSTTFWRTARIDYNELTKLTRKIDDYVQKLLLVSLGDNLFLICIQLLKGLQTSQNLYETIYFFWSVGFIILRTGAVAFSAAAIHDESKEAKTVLYSVPDSDYSAETRRFLTQLATNDVALTGCQFFSITRGLILTIAGTIVTYEVILVQFNAGNDNIAGNQNKTHCFNY